MILFHGGQGYSIEDAIKVIGAKNSVQGVTAEYQYLTQRFGQKDKDWSLISQALLKENNKSYDKMSINVDDKQIDLFFDITEFLT